MGELMERDAAGMTRAMVAVIVVAACAALVGVDRMTHRVKGSAPCERARVVYAGRLLWGVGRHPRQTQERYRGPVVVVGSVRQVGARVEIRQARRGDGLAVCCADWRAEGELVVCDVGR